MKSQTIINSLYSPKKNRLKTKKKPTSIVSWTLIIPLSLILPSGLDLVLGTFGKLNKFCNWLKELEIDKTEEKEEAWCELNAVANLSANDNNCANDVFDDGVDVKVWNADILLGERNR